jgi:hypothetical protein
LTAWLTHSTSASTPLLTAIWHIVMTCGAAALHATPRAAQWREAHRVHVAVHLGVVLAAVAAQDHTGSVEGEVYDRVYALHQVAYALVPGFNLGKLLHKTAAR